MIFLMWFGVSFWTICPSSAASVRIRFSPTDRRSMRHTRAMHLYQSGMPMVLLSQYLGHAQVETTMIYAHADTEMKRAAIQKADAVRKAKPAPDEIWADNEEMILKLSGLT